MSTYNIEMNYFNGSGYDQLRPRTILNNVTDWSNTLYSKTQVDSKINTLTSTVDDLNDSIDSINSGKVIPWTSFKSVSIVQNNISIGTSGRTFTVSIPANYLSDYEDVMLVLKGNYSCKVNAENFRGEVELTLNNVTTPRLIEDYSSSNGTFSLSNNNYSNGVCLGLLLYTSKMSYSNYGDFGNSFYYVATEKANTDSDNDYFDYTSTLADNSQLTLKIAFSGNSATFSNVNINYVLTIYKRPSILNYTL